MNRKLRGSIMRKKRSDARIGAIEKRYGVDFNARSDMKLGAYLKSRGYRSLSKALESTKKM